MGYSDLGENFDLTCCFSQEEAEKGILRVVFCIKGGLTHEEEVG